MLYFGKLIKLNLFLFILVSCLYKEALYERLKFACYSVVSPSEDLSDGDYEVVVARYKENVDWIKSYFPYQKVTLYNKGPADIAAGENVTVIPLKNVGRESHTYLYHIVYQYRNLKKKIIFLQGNPMDHRGADFFKEMSTNKLKKFYFSRTIVFPTCVQESKKGIIYHGKNILSKEALSKTVWRDTVFSDQYDSIEGFAQKYGILLPGRFSSCAVSYGAQFMVERENILDSVVMR